MTATYEEYFKSTGTLINPSPKKRVKRGKAYIVIISVSF